MADVLGVDPVTRMLDMASYVERNKGQDVRPEISKKLGDFLVLLNRPEIKATYPEVMYNAASGHIKAAQGYFDVSSSDSLRPKEISDLFAKLSPDLIQLRKGIDERINGYRINPSDLQAGSIEMNKRLLGDHKNDDAFRNVFLNKGDKFADQAQQQLMSALKHCFYISAHANEKGMGNLIPVKLVPEIPNSVVVGMNGVTQPTTQPTQGEKPKVPFWQVGKKPDEPSVKVAGQ